MEATAEMVTKVTKLQRKIQVVAGRDCARRMAAMAIRRMCRWTPTLGAKALQPSPTAITTAGTIVTRRGQWGVTTRERAPSIILGVIGVAIATRSITAIADIISIIVIPKRVSVTRMLVAT